MSDGLQDVIVLDLETARLSTWCRVCGEPGTDHEEQSLLCTAPAVQTSWNPPVYDPIGMKHKGELGLAIGGYYSYRSNTYTLFNTQTVAGTMQYLLETRPFLVSFNGIEFDYPVMRGVAWQQGTAVPPGEPQLPLEVTNRVLALCDQFRNFCAVSYDLLVAIWQQPDSLRYVPGLNTLDALCQANHLGTKFGNSAEVPGAWQRGEVALVANHCLADVRLTKRLFELAMRQGFLERDHGLRIKIPRPAGLPDWWHSDIRRDD